MKKLNTIMLVITTIIVCQLNIFAGPGKDTEVNDVNKATPCINLNKEVRKIMNYSDFDYNEQIQGTVVVKYKIDQNNKININEMQSNDDRLKDYVYSKLNGKEVCNNNTDGSYYIVKINFLIK